MNPDTGELARFKDDAEAIRNGFIGITEDQYHQLKKVPPKIRKNWMRNQPCKCGSGKKFKKCCW